MKKFAVVTVNYNSSSDIIELISCLEKCSAALFDFIIVDNHSNTENLRDLKNKIINTKFSIKLLELDSNLGFAGANNVAIKSLNLGDYQYVLLLNPDIIIHDSNFFEAAATKLEETKADILGPLVMYYPETEKIYFAGGYVNKYTAYVTMRGKKDLFSPKYSNDEFCDYITGCAMFVHTNVFGRVGLLPEDYFLYFEETDFCLAAKKIGCSIVYTPAIKVYHKVSTSITYLSNIYLYYMVRNYKIFALKYLEKKYHIYFWFFYIFVWCAGYLALSIVKKNYFGYKSIFKGAFSQ